MFNLEQSIAAWRKQMLDNGIQPAALIELENHLREEIAQQTQKGLTSAKAFETAAGKIGPARELKKEFNKVGETLDARMVKLIAIACVAVAALFSAWICIVLFTRNFGWLAQISGAAAFATTLLSWRYNDHFLPVVRNHWVRTAIGLVCCIGCVVWIQYFIVDYTPSILVQPGMGMMTFLWGWTLMAILGGIGFGLEKAARKSITS